MTASGEALVQAALPPRPDSVAESRRLLRRALAGVDRPDLVETAELLVSEVVTNALVHAGTGIDLVVRGDGDHLRVEVGDGSPHLPAVRGYSSMAGTGRGLTLLGQMARDWGVTLQRGGKTVWFEISAGEEPTAEDASATAAPTAGQRPAASDDPARVQVRFADLPLLLYEAWHQHAETLLREYLLVSLDDDRPGPDPIQVHAEASDALALLAEHLPSDLVSREPDQVLAGAVEPAVTLPVATVPVPLTSVPHFDRLDSALSAAVALADQGLFLTPPTQPELRELREWLCREVRVQSRHGEPTPWRFRNQAAPRAAHPLVWDPSAVAGEAGAAIAIDDTNQMIAVSRGAAALLGYDDPGELVGRRIVDIIPERFRQAHLAGFTLLFLTGRAPLLGRTVQVPALRGDGSETAIELTLHAEHAPHGRRVFVGRFRAPD